MFNYTCRKKIRQVLIYFVMLSIPPEMSKMNSFIITNIPSAKDLYEKMGFRYQNGLGHNSVENAQGVDYANQPLNAKIESLYGVNESIETDIKNFENKS